MSSGVSVTRTGSFTSDGSARSIRTLGFRPRVIKVINITSRDGFDWFAGMADASALKTVAAGTRTAATTNGITPLSDGFTVGADADVNANGETVHWAAWE